MSYPILTRDEHYQSPGPKRILTVDGGGLRGVFSLKLLKKIEDILKEHHGGDDNFRLSHYFDLMAGTSTGSVIAALLALGNTVDQVREYYVELGRKAFEPSLFRDGFFRAKYDRNNIASVLRQAFGKEESGDEVTLGSDQIETGLLVMTKRQDTGSPWPLGNNPGGRYFDVSDDDPETIPNKDYPLWTVVRASTAAPVFFEGESIVIAENKGKKTQVGEFVDGGVSPHNNPALQALMYGTLSGYNVNWPLGVDKILLVSVGTGSRDPRTDAIGVGAIDGLKSLISIMDDSSNLNQLILQWMSHCPNASEIDSEVGTLEDDLVGDKPLLTYLRYNIEMSETGIRDELGFEISDEDLKNIRKLDAPDNMPVLEDIGKAAADKLVSDEHFSSGFDLR